MSRAEVRRYLKQSVRRKEWQERQCYESLASGLLPALRAISRRPVPTQDWRLAAWGWNKLGDLLDYCDAPRSALRAYRRCLHFDPAHDWALAEVGNMLYKIGRFREAEAHLAGAKGTEPHNDWALDYLEDVRKAIRTREGSSYPWSDPVCRADEFLARGQPRAALRTLRKPGRTCRNKPLARARALGALGESTDVLAAWTNVFRNTRRPVILGYGDWFYVANAVIQGREYGPTFWRILLRYSHRLEGGYFDTPDGVYELFPMPKHERYVSKRFLLRQHRSCKVSCQYRLADVSDDLKLAKSLQTRYPSWKAARELVRAIHTRLKKAQS